MFFSFFLFPTSNVASLLGHETWSCCLWLLTLLITTTTSNYAVKNCFTYIIKPSSVNVVHTQRDCATEVQKLSLTFLCTRGQIFRRRNPQACSFWELAYWVESHAAAVLLPALGAHTFKQLHRILFPCDTFEQLILNELTQKLITLRNNSLRANQWYIPRVTVLLELETK